MDVEKALQKIENAEIGDIFEVSTTERDKNKNNEFKLVLGSREGKNTTFYLAEDVEKAGVEKSQLPLPTWGEKLEGVPDDKLFTVFFMNEFKEKDSEEKKISLSSHEVKYSFPHGNITKLEKNGNIFD